MLSAVIADISVSPTIGFLEVFVGFFISLLFLINPSVSLAHWVISFSRIRIFVRTAMNEIG